MRTTTLLYLHVGALALVAGCSTTPDYPLVFGSSNTFGVGISGSAPEQGGEFTLGFKSYDFAVVPVTVHQPDGEEQRIGMKAAERQTDAFSVLGQFSGSSARGTTEAPGTRARLGKFFATGQAAKTLGDGFSHKLAGNKKISSCGPQDPAQTDKKASPDEVMREMEKQQQAHVAMQAQLQRMENAARAAAAPPAAKPADPVRRGQALFFAQYEALGFVVTGGTTTGGADLTLGFKDRNLAIVPVLKRSDAGRAEPLLSEVGAGHDALSVLGQFEFDAQERSLAVEAGLGKFFSTGGAARRLADGFAVRLCEEYVATPAKK
jgi:hypothetical protein